MTLFSNEVVFGGIFVVLTLVSLAEIAYVVCVMERKIGALEHRLQATEHTLQHYMAQHDILSRQLENVKIELLSNQCHQLAKNRLMRREFRVLLKKLADTNTEDLDQAP
jgi:hypothetical protein